MLMTVVDCTDITNTMRVIVRSRDMLPSATLHSMSVIIYLWTVYMYIYSNMYNIFTLQTTVDGWYVQPTETSLVPGSADRR